MVVTWCIVVFHPVHELMQLDFLYNLIHITYRPMYVGYIMGILKTILCICYTLSST